MTISRRTFLLGASAGLVTRVGLSAARRSLIDIRTLDGGTGRFTCEALAALERSLQGSLIYPHSTGYESARAIWNQRMEDLRPAVIAQPRTDQDVAAILRFATDNRLAISVKGGGHSHLGFALCHRGLTIDLAHLASGEVDADRRIARVGPGLTFAQFDRLTNLTNLAATGAIVSMVGLPGYLLGGGIGWLHRKAGAGCDNVIGMNVVLANGERVFASQSENPDLFWAMRGGGGNFGIATRFHIRLHPVSRVYAGVLVFPLEDAPHLSRKVDDLMDRASRDLNVWTMHRRTPANASAPEVSGRPVMILAITHTGKESTAERDVALFRKLGKPLIDSVRSRAYPEWQAALDGAWGNGYLNEWVGHYLNTYDQTAIDTLLDFVHRCPSPHSDVKLARLGGAFAETGEDETAFGFRQARYAMVIQSRWADPAESDVQMNWTRQLHQAMKPFSNQRVYSNFIGHEGSARFRDAFTDATWDRLRSIKRHYDPANLFRRNVNIEP